MRIITSGFVFSIIGLFLLTSCAHDQIVENLDKKIAAEPAVTQAQERGEISVSLENAKNLNPEQRAILTSIRDEARKDLKNLRGESLKLRSVLIKDVVSPDYDRDEVALIKQKLKDVEDEKLRVIFHAIGRANETMGRWRSARARDNASWNSEQMFLELDGAAD